MTEAPPLPRRRASIAATVRTQPRQHPTPSPHLPPTARPPAATARLCRAECTRSRQRNALRPRTHWTADPNRGCPVTAGTSAAEKAHADACGAERRRSCPTDSWSYQRRSSWVQTHSGPSSQPRSPAWTSCLRSRASTRPATASRLYKESTGASKRRGQRAHRSDSRSPQRCGRGCRRGWGVSAGGRHKITAVAFTGRIKAAIDAETAIKHAKWIVRQIGRSRPCEGCPGSRDATLVVK